MLDLGHLPRSQGADVQVFTLPSTVTSIEWHTWQKPRGASFVNFFIVGGGAGGGGGFTGVATTARGGGGGGGSSAVSRWSAPAYLLPDVLFIQVGAGGAGVGSGGGTAGSGVNSLVCVAPSNNTSNLVTSSGTAPTGGGTGTGAAVGAAGAAGVAVGASNPFCSLGNFNALVGQVGIAGGAVAGGVGGAQALPTASACTMGGTGGGGTTSADFAGGLITAAAGVLISDYAPSNAAAGSFDGCGGPILWRPWFSYCGMGGGSSNAAAGGNGGPGAYGSGGGGGGGGTTGGTGGNGGSGIVIVTAW
jgi:hypothetical protein